MFGGDEGASFLTESIRSSTSKEESPKVSKSSVGGLFEEKESMDDEIFSSSTSK